MYALLRKAKLALPSAAEEAARWVREGAVPTLRAQPGFLLYLGFLSESCEAVGISLFEDREAAHAALGRLREWAVTSMADVTQGEPEVRCGMVLRHLLPAPTFGIGGKEALFVTVREYRSTAPSEEMMPLLSEHVVPVMERHPGFRGFWTFLDECASEPIIAVSLWANRGVAFSAHERVLEVMATLRGVFPTIPTITAGAAQVIAASRLS